MNDSSTLFRIGAAPAILSAPDLIEIARQAPVHFMGIGGAGMAPLAELLLRSGGQVTGCDAALGEMARALAEAGVQVRVGHAPSHVEGCAALVVTAAVRAGHPEVQAARQRGIPVLKRAEALAEVVNRGTLIGIAGTHGKTTTTALTTAVLAAAGLDPTGLVGAKVPAWGGNLRCGADEFFVVEADEYDRSFLTLRPFIAVVTTLEADHLDIYESLAAIEEAFDLFVSRVPSDGLVVGCADERGVGRLMSRLPDPGERVLSYGLSAGAMLRGEEVRLRGAETEFSVRERGRYLGRAKLRAPGIHNVRNALAAAAVGRRLGAQWEEIAGGLASYQGVARRFESVGEARGVLIVDDYAHHPTELAATLAAARRAYPDRRVVAVFQPHLYSRTRDFAPDFARALGTADRAVVTDIYAAREEPIPGVDGSLIVEVAARMGIALHYHAERASLPEVVARSLLPGDLCLTLGAGDLDQAAREILSLLDGAGEE